MKLSVLIVQKDVARAIALASALSRHTVKVSLASTLDELTWALRHQQFDAVVPDLETVALPEVRQLTREFHLVLVCTHRVPDEEIWTAALNAGAQDVCYSSDVDEILCSIYRSLNAARLPAA